MKREASPSDQSEEHSVDCANKVDEATAHYRRHAATPHASEYEERTRAE